MVDTTARGEVGAAFDEDVVSLAAVVVVVVVAVVVVGVVVVVVVAAGAVGRSHEVFPDSLCT